MSADERAEHVEARLTLLEERVDALEKNRPGRKKVPVVVSEEGVCGIDPSRDSATCPDAGVYRFQEKCRGTACVQANTTYYKEYRAKGKVGAQEVGTDTDTLEVEQ